MSFSTTPPPQSVGLLALSDFFTGIDDRDELIAQIAAYRILGYSVQAIAESLCLPPQQVRHYLGEARERAMCHPTLARLLDDHALPMAVDNLLEGLQAKDKAYTLATLTGRGAFSSHSKSEAAKTITHLEVQVSMPATTPETPAIEGQIVGIPRKVKGDA